MSDIFTICSPKRLFVGVGVVTLVALIVAASTSTTAFGIYNTAWDGSSELQDVAEKTGATSTIARDTAAYGDTDPEQTIGIVLAPDQSYTDRERQRLARFVRRGGTLVVAGDYNQQANTLLRNLGATARLDGRPLRDEEVYYRSPAMPIARNVVNRSVLTGVDAVTLNHGTAVTPNGASVLVRTSEYAYLDTNSNGSLEPTDPVASHPVVTTESLGDGTVVVVGDPSIFINVMLERSGNRDFVRALLAPYSHVVLDYSHTTSLPPLAIAMLLLRESPLLQFAGGVVGTLALFVGLNVDIHGTLAKYRRALAAESVSIDVTNEELVAYLHNQYPEWDEDRLHRVVATRQDDTPPEPVQDE